MSEITIPCKNIEVIAVEYNPNYYIGCERIQGLPNICVIEPSINTKKVIAGEYKPNRIGIFIRKTTCTELGGCSVITIPYDTLLYTYNLIIEYTIAKKGDTLYLVRWNYDSINRIFYFVYPHGSETVYLIGYRTYKGKTYVVLLDRDFRILSTVSTVELKFVANRNVHTISFPATIAITTAILILTISVLATAGVIAWQHYEHLKVRDKSKAEIAKAEAIKSNVEALSNIINSVTSYFMEKEKKGEEVPVDAYISALSLVSGGTANTNALNTTADNVNDWWSSIASNMKTILTAVVGIGGLMLIVMKWNVIASVFHNIIETIRGRRRGE